MIMTMPENDQNKRHLQEMHEIEFIRAFVIPQKKQRFLEFVSSKKGRAKFTSELDHPTFIKSGFITKITPSQQTFQGISFILKNKHAPDICYVISSNEEIDSNELQITLALKKTIARGFGTILSLIPGKLAYFENEDGDMRFILEK